MLKKILIGVVIVFSLSIIVLGWDKTVSYVEGGREHTNKELDKKVPLEFEVSRAQALMRKETDRISGYECKLADLAGRRDLTSRKIKEVQAQLVGKKATLRKIMTLLEQKKEQYQIGPNVYTFAEVNNDALARLQDVRKMEENVAFHESLVHDLDGAIKQGRSNLVECRSKLAELNSKIEHLRVRNTNANIRGEVAKLANSLVGAPLLADSELEKVTANIERQVVTNERRVEARLNSGKANYKIDYDAVFMLEDAATEIGNYLGQASTDNISAVTPVDKPSAAEAIAEVVPQ